MIIIMLMVTKISRKIINPFGGNVWREFDAKTTIPILVPNNVYDNNNNNHYLKQLPVKSTHSHSCSLSPPLFAFSSLIWH